MQSWNNDVKIQLDNLPALPEKQEWKLGSWIEECHVRPEVPSLAMLPLTENQIGDVRVVVSERAWYIWNGLAWEAIGGGGGGGGISAVTASAPLSSSGGTTPNLSLTGVVPVNKGGTGTSAIPESGELLIGNGAGGYDLAALTAGTNVNITSGPGEITIDVIGAGTGTVTSVDVSTGTTGLTSTGGPIEDAGIITLGGTLAIEHGGTGNNNKTEAFDALAPTSTKGDLIAHNGAGNVRLPVGADGNVLVVDSTDAEGMMWSTVDLGSSNAVSGVLSVANGGTESDNVTDAFNTLSPMTTKGDLLGHDGTDNVRVPVGSDGNVLVANSSDAEGLVWGTVDLASSSAVSGVLPVTNGGSGRSSLTANNVLVGDGTNQVALVPPNAINDVLTWSGTSWVSAPPSGGSGGVTSVTASLPILSSGGAFPDISLTPGTVNGQVLTWNGTAWTANSPSGAGVATVTASSPLASSGGTNPNVSLTGVVPIANGGTGQNNKTDGFDALAPSSVKGDLIVHDGTDNVRVPVGSNGNVLIVDGTDAEGVAWGPLNLASTTSVSGLLPVGNGGTGVSTIPANGRLLIGNGTGYTVSNLIGTSGITVTNGPGTITLSGTTGTVTSVNVSGGSTGLTATGGPIESAGIITLGGTLAVGYGGTGTTTTPSNGRLLIGNGTGYTVANLTAGSGISIANGAGSITISATGGGGSTSPAGSSTQIQFNNSGSFGASSNLTYSSAANTFTSAGSNNFGSAGLFTTINGSLSTNPSSTDSFGIAGQANSSIYTYGASNPTLYVRAQGNLTLDSYAQARLGAVDATSVAIGRSGITTTVTGGLTQTGGVFSLTGSAASTISTAAGSLTVTSSDTLFLRSTLAGIDIAPQTNGQGVIITAPNVAGASTISLFTTASISGRTGATLTTLGTGNTVVSANNGQVNITANGGSLNLAGVGVNIRSSAVGTPVVINSNSIDADFRVSGVIDLNALYVDASTSRVGIGNSAPTSKLTVNGVVDQSGIGTQNTLFGVSAAANRSVASDLTAFGFRAGRAVSSGLANTAVGSSALGSATALTGNNNTAFGSSALVALNGTGAENTAVGASTMMTATTAARNVAVGSLALNALLSGTENVAVGNAALQTTTASNNTAVGFNALQATSSGSQNVAVGSYAADGLTTGAGNTIIGYNADVNVGGATNVTVIGNGAINSASNQISIGNASVTTLRIGTFNESIPGATGGFALINLTSTTQARIAHNVSSASAAFIRFYIAGGNGTGAAITQAAGGGFGVLYTSGSDYRLKQDVETLDTADALARVNALRPVKFRYNMQPDGPLVEGFIAHEAQAVVPQAVTHQKDAVDEEGNPQYQGIDQGQLVPLLTAALKKLSEQVKALQAEVASLRGQ